MLTTASKRRSVFIQMLPDAQEGAIDALEAMIADMKPLTSIIEDVQAAGAGKSDTGLVEALMDEIFKDMPEDYRVQSWRRRR